MRAIECVSLCRPSPPSPSSLSFNFFVRFCALSLMCVWSPTIGRVEGARPTVFCPRLSPSSRHALPPFVPLPSALQFRWAGPSLLSVRADGIPKMFPRVHASVSALLGLHSLCAFFLPRPCFPWAPFQKRHWRRFPGATREEANGGRGRRGRTERVKLESRETRGNTRLEVTATVRRFEIQGRGKGEAKAKTIGLRHTHKGALVSSCFHTTRDKRPWHSSLCPLLVLEVCFVEET